MDEGTFESIRDVIGSFFQRQDHQSSPKSHEESDNESQKGTNEADDEILKYDSCSKSEEHQEVETDHENIESIQPVEEPSKDTEKLMHHSARQALNAIRHSSSLLVYHTLECRIVPRKPFRTAESLISNHSVQASNIYTYRSSSQLYSEQDKIKPKDALEEITLVLNEPQCEEEFVAEHELLSDLDELPSKEFDELPGDLPDILPTLISVARMDLHETLSSHRKFKTNPSSSSSRKSTSLHESESFFSTSLTRNSSHYSFSPLLSDSTTQSTFLAHLEPMFKPLEELPPPYCF